jgi:hypothetical protein
MKQKFGSKVLKSYSDNRKSKIQNPKWGRFTLVVIGSPQSSDFDFEEKTLDDRTGVE